MPISTVCSPGGTRLVLRTIVRVHHTGRVDHVWRIMGMALGDTGRTPIVALAKRFANGTRNVERVVHAQTPANEVRG